MAVDGSPREAQEKSRKTQATNDQPQDIIDMAVEAPQPRTRSRFEEGAMHQQSEVFKQNARGEYKIEAHPLGLVDKNTAHYRQENDRLDRIKPRFHMSSPMTI